jgi:diacylglycerol kinase family enzyme
MDQNDQEASRYFINIADVGIGGVAAKMLNKSSRLLGASFTYHKVILQSFFSYKPVKIALKSADYSWNGEILSLCMANGRYFANGMCIAPEANISDGKIQLVIMGKVSILDYILNLSKIKRGIALEHPEVTYVKVDSCTIEAEELTCPIDMDGEFVGYAPLQLSIKKHSLMFLKAEA